MRNFQDTFETRKRSFISAFSICTTVPLRQHYWISACRGLIGKILHNCLRCKRDSISPEPRFMGDFPKERLSIDKTPYFAPYFGPDFGPYYLKRSKMTRTTKGVKKCFVVLFTCLTTRAIHIGLAEDLSTDGFLLALRRFISRCGTVEISQWNKFCWSQQRNENLPKTIKPSKYQKLYVW